MAADSGQNGHHQPRGTVLDCRIEVVSDCSVVHVRGEVDLSTVHILNKVLDAAMAAPHPIILNFGETTYIDSTGIHAVLVANQRHRTTFAAAALAPVVRRVFELTAVDKVIPLYETLEAALSTECTPSVSGGGASLRPHSDPDTRVL